jgi:hypothetical protein
MMSNEHGRPECATGAQGAGEQADGLSSNGNRAYSALAGGATGEPWAAAGPDATAPVTSFTESQRTLEKARGRL